MLCRVRNEMKRNETYATEEYLKAKSFPSGERKTPPKDQLTEGERAEAAKHALAVNVYFGKSFARDYEPLYSAVSYGKFPFGRIDPSTVADRSLPHQRHRYLRELLPGFAEDINVVMRQRSTATVNASSSPSGTPTQDNPHPTRPRASPGT